MGGVKLVGYMMVAVLLISIVLMPMVEIFYVYRERLTLSDALYNSCRAATEGSYTATGSAVTGYDYAHMRKMDAVINEETFRKAFAEAFASSLNLSCPSTTANPLVFKPNNALYYNDFEVKLTFTDDTSEFDYASDNQRAVAVTVEAKSPYKFKIGYMQTLNNAGKVNYQLTGKREYRMEIIN